ncbi:hypothetical protein HD554DRAFT_2175531 [Boletus coccyginus]|nr:hypothetical protein HD554DRAFT_2175531 [Boletus coccyginus]
MFLGMEVAVLAQKIFICTQSNCWVTNSVAIIQLITDIISNIILVAAPIWFLQDVKLHQDCCTLVMSTFSASILITGVTILHSVLLFQEATSAMLIISHIKAVLTLFHSGISNDTVELTSIIDLPSKFSLAIINSVTSRVQSKGDAAHIKEPTPNPPAELD